MSITVELRGSGVNRVENENILPEVEARGQIDKADRYVDLPATQKYFFGFSSFLPFLALFSSNIFLHRQENIAYDAIRELHHNFITTHNSSNKLINGIMLFEAYGRLAHRLLHLTLSGETKIETDQSTVRAGVGINLLSELYLFSISALEVLKQQDAKPTTKSFHAEMIRSVAAAGLLECSLRVMVFLSNVTKNAEYHNETVKILERLLLEFIDIGEIKKAIIFFRANESHFSDEFKNTFRKRAMLKGFPDANFSLPKLSQEAANPHIPHLNGIVAQPITVSFPNRTARKSDIYRRLCDALSNNPIESGKQLAHLKMGLEAVANRATERVRKK